MPHEVLLRMLDNFEGSVKPLRSAYVVIHEDPQAKQSVRFGGHAFTDSKKREYVKKLTSEIRSNYTGPVLVGMVRLTIIYCFPWTKKESKTFATLGWSLTDLGIDLDNLQKPLKDAMKGVILVDDRQVVEVRARKIRYHTGMIALKIDEVMPNRAWGKLQSIG